MNVALSDPALSGLQPLGRPRIARPDPLLSGLVLEIAAYLAALAVCGILFLAGGASSIINLLAPMVITLAAGASNIRMVLADRNALLTPLFSVRLIAMTMLGLGGLFHVVAPAAIRDQMDYLYMTGPDDAAKVYLVWLMGMVLIMMGIAAGVRLVGRASDQDQGPSPSDRWGWRPPALAFLIGFSADSALALAQSFGNAVSVPAVASAVLTAISMTGLFFLGEQFGRSGAAKLICGFALLASILLGLVVMNKSLVMLPALILMLGHLRARFSIGRLLASAVLVTTLYLAINPMVFYSRIRDYRAHSVLGGGSLAERLSYISDYVDGDRIDANAQDTTAYSLSRLDYVMPAGFVIGQYDHGVSNDEIVNSGYMLVPRLLWPGKPITTTAGSAVNFLLGIQSTNQIAVTMFADIYWNLGFPGLLLMMVAGFCLGIATVVNRRILQTGDWLMMPFVFATFRFSLALDGNFATSMMIPIIMAFGLYWGLRVLRVMLPMRFGGVV